MELRRKICRCCGQPDFERQKTEAKVDPFFARHGLQVIHVHQVDIPLIDWGLRRKIDRLPKALARQLHRRLDHLREKHLLTSSAIRIAYGFCSRCHFLAPWHEIGDDQLSDYYAYYLTEEYKQARTAFQPGFAQLGQVMGSQAEALSRRKQHQAYALPYLLELRQASCDGVVHLLDHGGGEGLIIPNLSWVKGTVHDVESDQPANQEQLEGFDFVQCLHVLEHVGHPLRTYARLVKQCRRGGLIYIEVPIEFPGIKEIKAGNLPICSEHINKFCLNSIAALQQTAEVEVIATLTGEVDFLHLDGMTPVIRGLARKL
jgi:hypothetical protein